MSSLARSTLSRWPRDLRIISAVAVLAAVVSSGQLLAAIARVKEMDPPLMPTLSTSYSLIAVGGAWLAVVFRASNRLRAFVLTALAVASLHVLATASFLFASVAAGVLAALHAGGGLPQFLVSRAWLIAWNALVFGGALKVVVHLCGTRIRVVAMQDDLRRGA